MRVLSDGVAEEHVTFGTPRFGPRLKGRAVGGLTADTTVLNLTRFFLRTGSAASLPAASVVGLDGLLVLERNGYKMSW